jgi:hypothetical protein
MDAKDAGGVGGISAFDRFKLVFVGALVLLDLRVIVMDRAEY